ncbi:hypothetical protein [Rhodospirillum sp. A1_3_36]|uniref:hypothetical protein n=1 Tax=Rhodospirillum sp. A1_3_36 TaxID=3391666 RepID=UPI0039A6BD3A
MRIAFATTDLAHVNALPLSAPCLVIHEVSEEGAHLIQASELTTNDREAHLRLLGGCQFVFAMETDDITSALLRRLGCDVLLSHRERPIAEGLDNMVSRLRDQGSRWLRHREREARQWAIENPERL